MSNAIVLHVIGTPAPQGSKTRFGKVIVDGSSKVGRANLAAWREAVRQSVVRYLEAHPAPPICDPVSLDLWFAFALPASDQHRWRHATKPDIDKIERSTLDALVQGGLLKDDSLVWHVDKHKTYAIGAMTVGCRIIVRNDAEAEALYRAESKARAAAQRKAAKAAS